MNWTFELILNLIFFFFKNSQSKIIFNCQYNTIAKYKS